MESRLALSGFYDILEPQTTEELQQAVDKVVRVTALKVNEFGVFLTTEQMGQISLQSPDTNLKENTEQQLKL